MALPKCSCVPSRVFVPSGGAGRLSDFLTSGLAGGTTCETTTPEVKKSDPPRAYTPGAEINANSEVVGAFRAPTHQ